VQPKIKDRDSLGANANIHTISFSCLCLSTDSKTSISDSLPTQDNHQIIDYKSKILLIRERSGKGGGGKVTFKQTKIDGYYNLESRSTKSGQ
jgi:hypothetical protein